MWFRPLSWLSQALGLVVLAALPVRAAAPFLAGFQGGALVSVPGPGAQKGMEYLAPGRSLGGVFLRYRTPGQGWREADTAALKGQPLAGGAGAAHLLPGELAVESGFTRQGQALLWTLTLRNRSREPLEVGDLAVPLPMRTDFSKHGSAETSVLKHSFISGHGSFLFWMRPDSLGPFLTLTPTGATALEYWDTQAGYRVFVHAGQTLGALGGKGSWRQPGTTLTLAPAGAAGASQVYGFKLQWADGYAGVRRILVDEGKVDVQAVPGMTVPSDLPVTFALRSSQVIHSVQAEFPDATRVEALPPQKDGTRLYRVAFQRLGENRLTVHYGDGQRLYLECFSTEPLETLIRKRASFIAGHQVRDAGKWYDGLLAEWNPETGVLLGPDNYDRIKGWRIYEVTCDDPGLSKPAFLASKAAEFPVQAEVSALDAYVERFVWGGLQQTREEPFPFGIYGIPDWKQNRESPDPGNKGRRHLWRVYDYPHLTVMYLGLHRAVRNHPWLHTTRSAEEYLLRAYGTAVAMFTVPMAIEGWSAYETGLYNETVIPQLIRTLEDAGLKAEAGVLRGHWERKVQHFVNGQPDLFGSEYPFDSTGFESTHALAAYAMEASRGQDPRLRAAFPRKAAESFLERQLAANLFCRGWIEPAYYLLGSDYRGSAGDAFTLSYMSPMGGGSILDYGLRYAADPAPYLRLGYASLLSSWALMNTGTAATHYGYWFPGQANDGSTGGGFEPAAQGTTWLGQPHRRGSWNYSCETDLGYCGYLRNAATILADDPVFGRTCFGGVWRTLADGGLQAEPRDGVRRRFHARLGPHRLSVLLDQDRFLGAVTLAADASAFAFTLESDNPAAHTAMVRFAGEPGNYRVSGPAGTVVTVRLDAGAEAAVALPVAAGARGSYRIAKVGA